MPPIRPYHSFSVPVPSVPTGAVGDFLIKIDEKWLPYVLGALYVLTVPQTWADEAERSMGEARDLLQAFMIESVCPVPQIIGTLMPYVTASVPAGCLDCDGAIYLKSDYPALVSIMNSAWFTDSTHFKVPDLKGRVPMGKGTGSGLTARAMGDILGEQSHVITLSESAAHSHEFDVYGGGHNTSAGSNVDLSANNSNLTTHSTTSKGSNAAHNNIQPSIVVGWCVVAAN